MNKITRMVDFDIAVKLVEGAKTNIKLNFYVDNVFPGYLINELVHQKIINEFKEEISRKDYILNESFKDGTKNSRFQFNSIKCKYYKINYVLSNKTIAKYFKEKLESESKFDLIK